MAKKRKTTDALKILRKRYIKGGRKRLASVRKEKENFAIAGQIYTLRIRAGLSQKQVADMVGTTQSVISRLEDADYDGHSLAMLRRIAEVFHRTVRIQFVAESADLAYA